MTFLSVMYDENRVKKLPRRFPDKENLLFKFLCNFYDESGYFCCVFRINVKALKREP